MLKYSLKQEKKMLLENLIVINDAKNPKQPTNQPNKETKKLPKTPKNSKKPTPKVVRK